MAADLIRHVRAKSANFHHLSSVSVAANVTEDSLSGLSRHLSLGGCSTHATVYSPFERSVVVFARRLPFQLPLLSSQEPPPPLNPHGPFQIPWLVLQVFVPASQRHAPWPREPPPPQQPRLHLRHPRRPRVGRADSKSGIKTSCLYRRIRVLSGTRPQIF